MVSDKSAPDLSKSKTIALYESMWADVEAIATKHYDGVPSRYFRALVDADLARKPGAPISSRLNAARGTEEPDPGWLEDAITRVVMRDDFLGALADALAQAVAKPQRGPHGHSSKSSGPRGSRGTKPPVAPRT